MTSPDTPFAPLPQPETAEGKPRLTGVEIELGGLDEARCAALCARHLGSRTRQVDEAIWQVEDSRIGDLKVYLDTALRHADKTALRDAALTVGREVIPVEIVTDPLDRDTDNDSLRDQREIRKSKTDPLKADTDGDRLNDGIEIKRFKTNPKRKDTDKDGLNDRVEIRGGANKRYGKCPTNPRNADTDKDGLKDRREIKRTKTNPCDKNTDNGPGTDGEEVRAGSDPLDPKSSPGRG